ncbi:hypothetical protein F2Q70_00044154 [Brassica cretica]|uniref:Uncharacterized protein n=1 Tax=Brassica cretica TaxID=69181 RepID=A0A8S9KL71_BRACR|nr:hypothetical protein F2Q70_00044154 [Brassica cretica]
MLNGPTSYHFKHSVRLKELEAKTPRDNLGTNLMWLPWHVPEVTYEDGVTETIDMSREVWKLITV